MGSLSDGAALREEIRELKLKLKLAERQLEEEHTSLSPVISSKSQSSPHFLLLLADSALPLGSFAFSSGLESYLAHTRPASFSTFLSLSISSQASSTLPFLLAAFRRPQDLRDLDDALDASIMCTVGRRASVAQGRALLSIWERALSSAYDANRHATGGDVLQILKEFSASLKTVSSSSTDGIPPASAHLAPLFGVIGRLSMINEQHLAYVYMLSHVKAVLSAAVRAGVFGPYHAQKLLASQQVQGQIHNVIQREWNKPVADAGQMVPVLDLWMGRHELLYSRIFNS